MTIEHFSRNPERTHRAPVCQGIKPMLMTHSDNPAFPAWPMFGLQDSVIQFVSDHLKRGEKVAIATLVHTEGGAPRAPGTQMAFTDDAMVGFFSGGCIEADVALHARATLVDGEPRRLIYGEGSEYGDIRLQCGASITIAIERLLPTEPDMSVYERLLASREDMIWITDGTTRVVANCPDDLGLAWQSIAAVALARTSLAGQVDEKHYWVRYRPPVRIMLIGSDPTALAIAGLAIQAEFEVIFVRSHGPSHPPPLMPLFYRTTRSDKVFDEFGLDGRTAVVFANHDFEASREAVARALQSDAGYVGMIGSSRQRASREEWLREKGLGNTDIARFRSPIGVPVGKSSPVAIAISVIAEILQVMNQRAEQASAAHPDG